MSQLGGGDRAGTFTSPPPADLCQISTMFILLFAGLDVLINNAGILRRSGFDEVRLEEVSEAMSINLHIALRLSQASRHKINNPT